MKTLIRKNIYFYAPEIKDCGAYCFCPVCHSVNLSETLTLLTTFEECKLELSIFHRQDLSVCTNNLDLGV